jgi:hypothetical protein
MDWGKKNDIKEYHKKFSEFLFNQLGNIPDPSNKYYINLKDINCGNIFFYIKNSITKIILVDNTERNDDIHLYDIDKKSFIDEISKKIINSEFLNTLNNFENFDNNIFTNYFYYEPVIYICKTSNTFKIYFFNYNNHIFRSVSKKTYLLFMNMLCSYIKIIDILDDFLEKVDNELKLKLYSNELVNYLQIPQEQGGKKRKTHKRKNNKKRKTTKKR